jgi:hypothetical protein
MVVRTVSPAAPGHPLVAGLAGLDALRDDLRHLAALEVARNFPRDDKGRLQAGAVVLLARYGSAAPLPRFREVWLVAEGPARRSDPQVITVKLDLLIGENHPHNWSRLRWWWDARSVPLGEQERWGVTGAALRAVTGPRRSQALARLHAAWREGALSRAERIALCTALQDDGRFEDALRLCDVEHSGEISRLLNAEKFHLRGGCDHPPASAFPARAAKLRRALWEAAPWRFAEGLEAAQARLDAWRQERPGRERKTPQMRLIILPGSKHARKPCLMLECAAGGGPRLAIHFTASNVACPESEWKRPVELDIARWGGAGTPPGGRS